MQLLKSHCHGRVLNLFAGKSRLNVGEYRVDVSEEFNPHLVCDALEFIHNTKFRFNTVIMHPTKNLQRVWAKYTDGYIGRLNEIKDSLENILEPHATVISIGNDTNGMGKNRLFFKSELCIICHGFGFLDSIIVVEQAI